MSEPCDFNIAVRIIPSTGGAALVDLNDHAAGYSLMRPLQPPADDDVKEDRISAPYVTGSYQLTDTEDDALFPMVVRVRGANPGEIETRWQAVRAAYRSEPVFYLELYRDGVTKRWWTERPNVQPLEVSTIHLRNNFVDYRLTFRVQPNPTITIA